MLKKIATAIAASAFALAVYAPAASACPAHDKGKIAKKEKEGDSQKDDSKTAEAEKKEDTKNEKKEDEGKKVSRK